MIVSRAAKNKKQDLLHLVIKNDIDPLIKHLEYEALSPKWSDIVRKECDKFMSVESSKKPSD